ncbi:MAG: hypothetical protein JWL92_369 [Candidatus Nomurabacteria bacterium]|nr:hypothetical protein [Candidatus Nomurabacteria bacterium]
MKTMTCRQMGGMCDTAITAATPEEMINKGMDHLREAHPEMVASIESMPKDDPLMLDWSKKFMEGWEKTPENA